MGLTSNIPLVVNQSFGAANGDAECLGENGWSSLINDMYEDGILTIVAAGNEGHPSLSDCTLRSPASAIGAFVVGAHYASDASGETNVRSDVVWTNSMGGSWTGEGKRRSIVDITAYGYRSRLFDTSGGYTNSASGTSLAAPVVTAAALDLIDMYNTDHPGLLHAQLLMFGDRAGGGGKMLSGFDSVGGAGRLKARKWDAAGLDEPYGILSGSTCVGDGEVSTILSTQSAVLPTTIDVFKAVIWYYDRRHQDGTTIDDIDLVLRNADGTVLRHSVLPDEEKERVYSTAVGGQAIRLEVVGDDVTADDEGCGTNRMKVYYAWFMEDSARDDQDGPGVEIELE